MSNIDFKQFKEAQQKSWDSVALGWQKWWKTIEKGAQNLSNHLVELAKINTGSKVLDIATGIGEPAITAAKKVRDGSGHVLGTDISPQMLSVARQRAASLGLQDVIEFKEGDAETISLPDFAFDAVLCIWIDVFARSERRLVKYLQIIGRWRSYSSCGLGFAR